MGGDIALNPFNTTFDRGGYNNEQILSSTLFRLYRSIGGDSGDLDDPALRRPDGDLPDVAGDRDAHADDEPATAAGFEAALRDGGRRRLGAPEPHRRRLPQGDPVGVREAGHVPGGRHGDAQQQRGRPAGGRRLRRRCRGGEYTFQEVFWDNQNIWNRRAADGGTAHRTPSSAGRTTPT